MSLKHYWFYNTDNGRPDAVVNREVKAMLDFPGTRGVFLSETVAFSPNPHPDYDLIRYSDKPVHLMSPLERSRNNITCYLLHAAPHHWHDRWLDMEGTWPRTKYGGVHEARSFPVFRLDHLRWSVIHFPPKNARPRIPLQQECVDALAEVEGLDVVIGDFNAVKGQPGPGPDAVAANMHGRTVGDKIDTAVVRYGVHVHDFQYFTAVKPSRFKRPVQMLSDHGHTSRLTLL